MYQKLRADAARAEEALRWLGVLGGNAPLFHFERACVLVRDLADSLIGFLALERSSGSSSDLRRCAQIAVWAQHALTRSRVVDICDRVGEVAVAESWIREVAQTLGPRASAERPTDALAPAGG